MGSEWSIHGVINRSWGRNGQYVGSLTVRWVVGVAELSSGKVCTVGALKIPVLLSTKYLGIIINKSLRWHDHLNHISKKLSYASRILSKVRHFVPKTTLINLYYSFVYPHIKYAIVALGGTNSILTHQLQIIQNKIVRFMNFKCLKDHVEMTTLYKSMNILKISDIYELEKAKFIH